MMLWFSKIGSKISSYFEIFQYQQKQNEGPNLKGSQFESSQRNQNIFPLVKGFFSKGWSFFHKLRSYFIEVIMIMS